GLGGTAGDGRQSVAGLHARGFGRAVYWLLERPELSGPVNLAAPDALPNRDFMAAWRRAWGTAVGLPASRWMLEAGAFVMRTETELVLKSRRIRAGRLLDDGFVFKISDWPAAARDLCTRWRAQHRGSGDPVAR